MTTNNNVILDQIEDLIQQLTVLQQELCEKGLDFQNDAEAIKLLRKLSRLTRLPG